MQNSMFRGEVFILKKLIVALLCVALIASGGCARYLVPYNDPAAVDEQDQDSRQERGDSQGAGDEQGQGDSQGAGDEQGQYDSQDQELALSIGHLEPDMLHFASLENFLLAHRAARAGGDITEYIAYWRSGLSDTELADAVRNTNLSGLEKLYLLTNVPEDFQIHRIDINESFVTFWYMPTELLDMEYPYLDAMFRHQQRDFQFSFTRWSIESPLDSIMEQSGIGEEDLIDGMYRFNGNNLIEWASGSERIILYTPLDMGSDPENLVRFAEMIIVDLSDESEVAQLLIHL